MLSHLNPALDVSSPGIDEIGLSWDRENSQERTASPFVPEQIQIRNGCFVAFEV